MEQSTTSSTNDEHSNFLSLDRSPTVDSNIGAGGVGGTRLEIICRAIRNDDSGANT